LVLRETYRGAARVAACSAEAYALGILVGMPLAEAHAFYKAQSGRRKAELHRRHLAPRDAFPLAERAAYGASAPLHVEPYDPVADREALERLALGCQRFSPLVGLEDAAAPSSLLLDITGLEPLFGSETALANQVVHEFARCGLVVRGAIADTLGAAWAVAHYGGERGEERGERREGRGERTPPQFSISNLQFPICNTPPGGHLPALRPLPIESLRLPEEIVDLLHQLGVYRVEQLESLPRQDLAVRFGSRLIERMDQAAGRLSEPLHALPLPPELEVQESLEYPTTRREIIELLLEQLLGQLSVILIRLGRGAVRLECRLSCEASQEVELSVGLFQPVAAARHLVQLVQMRLERTALPAAVCAVHIRAALTAPLARLQQELFDEGPLRGHPRHLAGLVDRLSSRLGRKAVVGVRLLSDAQPELAYQYDPLVADGRKRPRNPVWRSSKAELLPRPLRLLRRPVALAVVSVMPDGPPTRFHWRNDEHRIAHNWGPERIETGWWRGQPVGRDYYRVETASGARYWLFRRLRDEKWFLHGTFE
jgi:protein ImuB